MRIIGPRSARPHIDVLVSPTSSDCGAPYAILEALQSGACVVLSKNAWLDDRLVEPAVRRTGDGVSALVTELEDLLQDRNLERAQAAARPLWHKEFSMTALHGDLLAAYAAVAPKHLVGVTKTTSVMPPVSSHR